jgi:plasmid stability protein
MIARRELKMANLLIRDVPEKIVARLKEMAKRQNRSLQQELHSILVATATQSSPVILRRASKIRAELRKKGISFSDSAELLRKDRSR